MCEGQVQISRNFSERRALRQAIKALPPLSDEDEAAIQTGIARDPENPELTAQQMAELRPLGEVSPQIFAAVKRALSAWDRRAS